VLRLLGPAWRALGFAVMTTLLAGSTGLATDWPQFHRDARHSGVNPLETVLKPANVSRLDIAWTGRLAASGGASVAVARGVVVAVGSGGKFAGRVWAFATDCGVGGAVCRPLWIGRMPAGIGGAPAIAKGIVYVGSGDGTVSAFRLRCRTDGGTCAPVWTGQAGGTIGGSPAVAGGLVVVPFDAGADSSGVAAFRTGCATDGGTCRPAWTGRTPHWTWGSSPAIADNFVYIGAYDGTLSAFRIAACERFGRCRPAWTGATGDSINGSAPTVVDGVVYISSYGWDWDAKLWAFPARCPTRSCGPLWKGPLAGYGWTTPAVVGKRVYVGTQNAGLYVYRVGCGSGGATCAPLWIGAGDSIASPVVANGVVYSGSFYHALIVWKAGCSVGSCPPLLTREIPSNVGMGWSSPVVVDGAVYLVHNATGTLVAWKLDGGVAPAARFRGGTAR
jgi:hypothetical protein